MAKEELTPMMRQFHDMKASNPDAILLFRCGDFYETYCEDAVIASQVLGITLTKRNQKGANATTEMAGFPHHALDNYLPRLIRAGFRVAICDQLEDPKLTKKLVKRGITELVTPGVALGDNVLSSRENNFLAALHFGAANVGLSLLDISTGEYLVAEGDSEYIDKLLTGFAPKEVLIERGEKGKFEQLFSGRYFVFELDDWAFSETSARTKVLKHFDVQNLKGFGVDHLHTATTAAGAILTYLEQTQHHNIEHITRITRIEEQRYVRLDKFTIRNLELISTNHGDGTSLLSVLDRTLSPMGARLMRRWMLFPLRSVQDIERRLDSVEHFFREPEFRELCEMELGKVGDLERIVSKVATGRINPREMQQLRCALETVVVLKNACKQSAQESIRHIGEQLDACTTLRQRIERELRNDPPLTVNKGQVIADGVNAQLDELRNIQPPARTIWLQIQEREIARTGIQSLKIGFNNVFGYYMEVRNTYKEFVPQEWIRKQTLVNAERYITQELKEYEEKILGAEDKFWCSRRDSTAKLVAAAAEHIVALQRNAQALAELDVYHSFARLAMAQRYVRPVVDESEVLDIKAGRHPVIETLMPPGEEYVPNDVLLDTEQQQIIIITGPNMAGKSALLRQTALITLMAQIGSFVPADSCAVWGWSTRFHPRGGFGQYLGGRKYLHGRNERGGEHHEQHHAAQFGTLRRTGTRHLDLRRISIAWSIVEHLHERPKMHARTLFATHYHELNDMEERFSRIKNYNVSVREVDHRIVFLRKLARGGSEHSFGIHVARLAGMPNSIVQRAETILHQLETNNADNRQVLPASAENNHTDHGSSGTQLSFFQLDDPVLEAVRDEILHLDVNNLTPVEALNKLNDIRKIITGS